MVIRIVQICQSGVWQPVGGSGGIGTGQAWINVIGSRGLGGTYTNATSKPIMVAAGSGYNFNGTWNSSYVNGIQIQTSWTTGDSLFFIVPSGATYKVTMSAVGLTSWYELR